MGCLQGVGNVAQAAKELGGFQRVVLVSSGLVTPARRFHPIRIMLNSIVARGQLDAKWKGDSLRPRNCFLLAREPYGQCNKK